MSPPSDRKITPETVRELARAAGIRPEEAQLGALAASLEAMLATIERCEALNLAEHEPATALRLSGGAVDAEL